MNISVIIISLIVGIIFMAVALLISQTSQRKKKDTIKTLILDRNASFVADREQEQKSEAKGEKAKEPRNIAKKLKEAAKAGAISGMNKKSIRYMLIQSGSEMTVGVFWMWASVSGFLILGLCYVLSTSPLVTLLLGFTGFFGLPRYILKRKVTKRQKKFLEEFADALEAMIRLLKSGMPISEAIAMSAREYTGPIGEEMSRVYEAQRVGDTLPQAVEKLAFRVPLPEVQMFTTAVIIQTQTGSSLSEVLQNLATVIRQRYRLKRKVLALSAEAKISAMIIGALPCVVIVAMYLLNKEYIMLLVTTDAGKNMTYFAIAWMGVGVYIMKQMINFKV